MAGTRKSGGKPTPTALKVLRGSKLRPHNRREPKYAPGVPRKPPHVATDPLASRAWKTLVSRLSLVHVLTPAHGEALAVLADAWADYIRCREQFERTGRQFVVVDEKKTPDGTVTRRIKDNPLIRRSERLALLVNRMLGEFGLTPATGPKVAALGDGVAEDPFARFDIVAGGKA